MSFYTGGQIANGLKWFQGGIMWNAVLEYGKATGDHQYDNITLNALYISSTMNTIWQGVDVVPGQIVRKYNDDTLWVGIATSAIANSQQIYLGAKLYKITKSVAYLNNNYSILKWMRNIDLVTPDFHVYDGVLTAQDCAVYYQKELSYQVGELIGALSFSYMYSNDVSFLTLAENLFLKSSTIFMQPETLIVYDDCEPSCNRGYTSPKGIYVHMLGVLYQQTSNSKVKSLIRTALKNSVSAMLKVCTNLNQCGNNWYLGKAEPPSVVLQINAVELMQLVRLICQIKVSFINIDSVQQYTQNVAKQLMSYYIGGQTAKNLMWYEGGIMWGAMLEYIKVSGDNSFIGKISNAIQLSGSGTTGSFLGISSTVSETIGGRWNDDILWWAIACATGSEIYGGNAIPDGVSFQSLTQTTYNQVWSQWDPTCSGGIWWSRDRSNVKFAGYKSSITNTEEMLVGAKLAIATGQSTYVDNINQIYSWMNQTGLLTSGYGVFDGIHCDKNCSINSKELSYQAGMLIGALTFTYAFTQDQAYMTAANNVAKASFQTFLTNGSVIYDSYCEPNCPTSQVTPKGVYTRMLGYLYEYTTDDSVKGSIKTALQNSFSAMLTTCDSKYNCGNNWASGNDQNSTVHTQINALELAVAYSKTFVSGPITAPQGLTLTDSTPSTYFGMSKAAFTMIVCASAAAIFALISVILKAIVRKFSSDDQKM
ncbi:hydrolase 76 protein [Terramyces sp. JEL0728]|nr:hydrolase 76 protein [Terramyces sp. JEL0728]